MGRVEVISGVERRRRWSDAEKRQLVAAAFMPGAVVSEVARRADIHPNQLYRWRQEFRSAPPGFSAVMVADDLPAPAQAVAVDPRGAEMIEIVLAGRASVRLPSTVSPDLAAAVIGALVRR